MVVFNSRSFGSIVAALTLCGSAFCASAAPMTDKQITTYLKEHVDDDDRGIGIVVGVIDERGPRVFSYGTTKNHGTNQVNADTLFEIGSITKIFTTLLLQNVVERGEVKLDDPIGKFLPASVKTPSFNGKQITLLDLATHSSSLPRLPPEMANVIYMMMHRDDPYAGFRERELYHFLSTYKLEREIGSQFEYSNVGMELLGHVLSLRAGTNYEALVRERICQPLQMTNTFVTVPPALEPHFATGHDPDAKPVKNWSAPLPGDGGLRSSVNDMLKFLAAEMGVTPSSLSAAMAETQKPRRPTDDANMKIGLGWIVTQKGFVWHDGETAGFSSWIGFNPGTHYGIVVLSNYSDDGDEVGETIFGLRKRHRAGKIDYNLYDQYTGKYQETGPEHGVLAVTREGTKLFARYTGQDKFEVLPESAGHLFNIQANIQLVFKSGANGVVTGLTLIQDEVESKFIKQK